MILVIRTFRIFSNKGFPIYVYKALKENKKVLKKFYEETVFIIVLPFSDSNTIIGIYVGPTLNCG